MADWDGLRHDLERAVSPPSLNALRERRRRRQQRRAIATTFAVVMVGTAGGVAVLGRASQQREAGPVAGLNQVVNSDDLPPPKDYEDPVVTDVDFVSANVGWAIGLRCVGDACDVLTWRTNDGGVTWGTPSQVASGVPRVTFKEESPSGGAVRSLRMVDEQNGFAFNPGLYVTSDGGTTWRRLPQESKATSVGIAGTSFWVTERGCAMGVDCDVRVRTGTVGSDSLEPLRSLPKTQGARAVVRRAGERNAYLLTYGLPRAAFHATSDSGRTWNEGTNPCPDATAESLSAGIGRPLWLVCTSAQGRTAYQSADQGTTWSELPAPPADGVVTDLIARSANDAYLATQQPARLFVTADGGRTWQRAEGTGNGFGYGNLDVVDATHAWAMGDAGVLWRTTDGTTWERLALPPGAPRATATPKAEPTATPTAAPLDGGWLDLFFLDERTGWALRTLCPPGAACHAILRRTDDGGSTWSALPFPEEPFGLTGGVSEVVFADRDNGYVFGPELYVTHDGGKTWETPRVGRIWNLAVANGFVWIDEYDRCSPFQCFEAVRKAPVGSTTFTTVLDTKTVQETQALSLAVEGDDAYLYTSDRLEPAALYVTTNGGTTWSKRTPPCASFNATLDAAGSQLWAMCHVLGGDTTDKTVHSADGGQTWIDADAENSGARKRLFFVALTPSVGWTIGSHGLAAEVTRDGGRTWTATPVPVEGTARAFQMLDETHGFAIVDDVFLRTTDGQTWERIATPPAS